MDDFAPLRFSYWQLSKRSKHNDEWRRKLTMECNEHYGSPGTVCLASTTPRKMTYWLVPSVKRSLWMLANAPVGDLQYFYLIIAGEPVYTFLDFDAPPHCFASYSKFRSTVLVALAYLCRFLDAAYGCLLPRRHYDGQWRLFDASTADKWSMHAHARLAFKHVNILGEMIQRFHVLMKEMRHFDERLAPLFFGNKFLIDLGVYNARPFRLPHCRKAADQDNFLRPLLPEATFGDDVLWGYIHAPRDGRLALPLPPDRLDSVTQSLDRPLCNIGSISEEVWRLANDAQRDTDAPPLDSNIYCQIFADEDAFALAQRELISDRPRKTPTRRSWTTMILSVVQRNAFENASALPLWNFLELADNALTWTLLPYQTRLVVVARELDSDLEMPAGCDACCAEYAEIWALLLLFGTCFEVDDRWSDAEAVRALCEFASFPRNLQISAPTFATFCTFRRALQQSVGTTPLRSLGSLTFLPPVFDAR